MDCICNSTSFFSDSSLCNLFLSLSTSFLYSSSSLFFMSSILISSSMIEACPNLMVLLTSPKCINSLFTGSSSCNCLWHFYYTHFFYSNYLFSYASYLSFSCSICLSFATFVSYFYCCIFSIYFLSDISASCFYSSMIYTFPRSSASYTCSDSIYIDYFLCLFIF